MFACRGVCEPKPSKTIEEEDGKDTKSDDRTNTATGGRTRRRSGLDLRAAPRRTVRLRAAREPSLDGRSLGAQGPRQHQRHVPRRRTDQAQRTPPPPTRVADCLRPTRTRMGARRPLSAGHHGCAAGRRRSGLARRGAHRDSVGGGAPRHDLPRRRWVMDPRAIDVGGADRGPAGVRRRRQELEVLLPAHALQDVPHLADRARDARALALLLRLARRGVRAAPRVGRSAPVRFSGRTRITIFFSRWRGTDRPISKRGSPIRRRGGSTRRISRTIRAWRHRSSIWTSSGCASSSRRSGSSTPRTSSSAGRARGS